MILKDRDTNFSITLTQTNKIEGLEKGDTWCHVLCKVSNQDFDITIDDNILSNQEVLDLSCQLSEFINTNLYKKKRIAFIKNFLVIYLSVGSRLKKIAKIKFVHAGSKKESYVIQLEENEIKELIDILNKKD